LQPVDLEKIDDEQREALAPMVGGRKDVTRSGGHILNIFRTLVHAPKALTAFLAWGGYILSRRNSLSERDRELVILRVGYNCKSGYEFTQHSRIGLDAGLTEAEVAAIKAGPDDPSWNDAGSRDAARHRRSDPRFPCQRRKLGSAVLL
jgi:4-carboxymuconolactone decarboxylase